MPHPIPLPRSESCSQDRAIVPRFVWNLKLLKIYLFSLWFIFNRRDVSKKSPTIGRDNHKSVKEEPLPCQENMQSYSGPINLVPLLGGKHLFCPPLPYFWLSARAETSDPLEYGWPAVSVNSFYPVTSIYQLEKKQLLPEQLITRNILYRSIISLHMHHA